jgi:tRNA-guanine family transglycosylase
VRCEEPTAWKLISYHNIWYYERLMERCRAEIEKGTFGDFAEWFLASVDD